MSDSALTVDTSKLSVQDLAKANDFARAIDPANSGSLIQFGVGAQSKISGLADTMLTQIRTKDSGEVGKALTDLVLKVKDVDVGGLTKARQGLFARLANKFQRFIAKYEKLETQIDKIVDRLAKARMMMLTDINLLDQLYQQNNDYLHNLDLYIAGGQLGYEKLKTTVLPQLRAKAQASKDPLDAQNLNDLDQFLVRVEKKLYDLKLSRMISIQTAPQVRLIQNNDQALVEKIQSSILTTIPLWKSQIVIAISLFRQKQALGVQKAVTDATNDLLTRNSELLKQGSIDVARETERGIVDIETLRQTNANLIATIEETLRIQEEGKQKRADAEKSLLELEADLKAKLIAVRGAV
ncbi:MAG: tellurium resistance protein [Spirochaetes bacterium RBG_16_67_19]|nr:MAG: tellurium resistance protein [Spirochaetes bacterium GWB1_66_5]OHD74348.1 MAG: tellurium resistance protein [Spirochaetes bacterium RBG_16_67_19]